METTRTRVPPLGPLRCLAVGVIGGAALLALGWLCLASTLPVLARLRGGTVPGTDPAAPVLVLAGVAGAVACLYLSVIVARTAWAAARGGLVRSDGLVRRLTLAACGTALAVASLAPAHAADLSDLDGLPLPERPTSSATPLAEQPTIPESSAPAVATPTPSSPAASSPTAQAASPPLQPSARPSAKPSAAPSARPSDQKSPAVPATVPPRTDDPATASQRSAHQEESGASHVVVPGDTLWALATELLTPPAGAPASGSSIASLVVEIHSASRDVIGPDPDLLIPGQKLSLPRPNAPEKEER